ncbi:hypothetical protein P5673_030650 [Acropora cervicornis]|uniref:Uncharacterized protein n=1 Tax=Acropora cervicornis TaxID=6130 RepID=A0AAD9PUA4_ACRCE|nr:hypothetical protein P5673_030650 [Acropora cervicornis]
MLFFSQAGFRVLKMSVWRQFKKACEESGKDAFHPNVAVAKPMSGLGLTCQQHSSKLVRSANLPDRENLHAFRLSNNI